MHSLCQPGNPFSINGLAAFTVVGCTILVRPARILPQFAALKCAAGSMSHSVEAPKRIHMYDSDV
jgi:hypothetical protein